MLDVALCDGPVLDVFPFSPCTLFGLHLSYSEMFAFLRMINLLKPFFIYSLWSLLTTTCGWRPSPALPVATELITSLILREDYAIYTAYLVSHFHPVIIAGCALFTSGSIDARSIWRSCALPNLISSTSDFVVSFCFVDELYNVTLVKDLGTYWLSAPFFQFSKAIPHIFA